MNKISTFVAATTLVTFPFAVGCVSSHEESQDDAKMEAEIENRELQAGRNHLPSETTDASLGSSLASAVPRPEGTIAWNPCPTAIYPDAECGTVTVPVDWSKPEGETLSLRVERLKATNPDKRRGSLWFASGSTSLWFDAKPGEEHAHSARLREYFDIVGTSVRGQPGGSNPIQCDTELLKAVAELDNRRPGNEAEYAELDKRVRAAGQDCRQRNGARMDNLDSSSVARDIDAFRAGLGEDKIHVYARSTASEVAERHAEMFPHRLGALVLDSVIDHSVDATTMLTRQAQGVDSAFVQFTAWARRTPGSALYGKDVQALWDGLHAKARAGKLIDPNSGKPIASQVLSDDMSLSLVRQAYFHSWPQWAQRLVDLEAGRPTAGFDPEPASEDYSYTAWSLGIECQNWDYGDVAEFTALDVAYRVSDAHLRHFHNRYRWQSNGPEKCRAWPAAVRNPQHRLSIDGGPKPLIVNSRYDLNTNHANAVAVHRQIPGSVLVTYEGVGHGAYDRSPCVRDYVDSYLVTGQTPSSRESCPAIWPTVEEVSSRRLSVMRSSGAAGDGKRM